MTLPETLYDTRVAKHLGNYKDQFATLVLTVSSIFEPFMPLQHRDTIHKVNFTYNAAEGGKCNCLGFIVVIKLSFSACYMCDSGLIYLISLFTSCRESLS